jgi:hypothetical protein
LSTIFGFLEKDKPEIFDGIDLSVFLDSKDHFIENRNYITCGFSLYSLYKDDNYALITANDESDQKLYDLSRDPEWNNDIAEENKDLCREFLEKIQHDANGHLLQESDSVMGALKDWYVYEKKDIKN